MITDDDNTAPGVVDFASATDISHTTARDVSATAPELEVAELDRVGATMDELTSTPAHVAEPCATSMGRHLVGRSVREDTGTHDHAGRGAGAGGHPHQMSKHCQAAKEAACQWRSAIGHVGAMVG